jgi:hypothetical protein
MGKVSTSNGAEDLTRVASPIPNWPSEFRPKVKSDPSPETNAA